MAQLNVSGKKKRSCVKQGERQNGKQCSASNPFQLLAEQGSVCLAVAAQEEQRGQNVKVRIVCGRGLVQAVLEQAGCQARFNSPQPKSEQCDARRVDDRQQPAAAERFEPFLRAAEGEGQNKGRLQSLGHYVGPENDLVERVPGTARIQLARVLEGVPRERDQAEQIKMSGARSTPAAEQDVETDNEVNEPDDGQAQRDVEG